MNGDPYKKLFPNLQELAHLIDLDLVSLRIIQNIGINSFLLFHVIVIYSTSSINDIVKEIHNVLQSGIPIIILYTSI